MTEAHDRSADAVSVERDDAGDRYVARLRDREVGSAYFENHPDGRVTFTHTETDQEVQGQGVASTLIRSALDDVRSRGLSVEARCAFVARFIDDHADYQDLLLRQ